MMMLRGVRRRYARLRSGALRRLLPRVIRTEPRTGLQRLGSSSCGWIVPVDILGPGAVCYCAGVGEDATFDFALADQLGCEVYSFDPTPRAIAYVKAFSPLPDAFHFLPIGLWSEGTDLRFYAPANPAHVSHSVKNLQATSEFFVAPCRTVSQVMAELGHKRLDVLKLDIEGAEHEVVRSLVRDGVECSVLCLEFDQPISLIEMAATLRRLRRNGFRVAVIDGWNFTFLHEGVS